ncbi:MAG: hypothetical protein HPY72_05795 [Anaerolineae bacterium]|nr:hypothetical protein [Anaerolineae bacterium]
MIGEKELRKQYGERFEKALLPIEHELRKYLNNLFDNYPRIDQILVRAKSVDSFINKSKKQENGGNKYSDPLNQIQDQIGARIVTF